MQHKPKLPRKHRARGVDILYEDRDILVVNKEAGLLTIATESGRDRTAYSELMDYVRKGEPKSRKRVFIVHRLDRETSGILVFAKSEEAKRALQTDWENTQKVYWAVVEGRPAEPEGTISSYLSENSAFLVTSSQDPRKGRLSHTHYRVLEQMERRALLEVSLLTGRKHQIRVHLAERGWPVVGDVKYGRRAPDSKRLALHAKTLTFNHPHTGARMTFEAPVPASFMSGFRSRTG